MTDPTAALVPFRAPGVGKTRLAPTLHPGQRAVLAEAMLRDVLRALRGAGIARVVVAAADARAAAAAGRAGVEAVLDPSPGIGLDAAIAAAVEWLDDTRPVLLVAADLPTLRSVEVEAMLASEGDVAIAATHGGGTGGLLRRAGVRFPTAYGEGSANRHLAAARAAGASVELLELAGFRHDVDVWEDLRALRDLPVGPSTAELLPHLLEGGGSGRDDGDGRGSATPTATAILGRTADAPEDRPMPQGTIKAFDAATGTGSLLDDTLLELKIDREAFVASGLQELRVGQRVRFQLEGESSRVAHLNIVSL